MLQTVTELKRPSAQTITRLAFSVEELAEASSLSRAFIRNEIYAGKLKAKKVGPRRVVVQASEWERYINAQADMAECNAAA